MASIEYTADDGSNVSFVDPTGVAQAVSAALAAAGTPAAPTIEEVDVKESDGSEVVTEPVAPAPEAELPAA